MSSLAELPELVGFSVIRATMTTHLKECCRRCETASNGEFSAQLGRSKRAFRLWQDQTAIAPGKLWKSEIKTAIDESFFSFP